MMNKFFTIIQKFFLTAACISFVGLTAGCDYSVPELPQDEISMIKSPEVREAVRLLYHKKAGQVLKGMRAVSEKGAAAEEAGSHLLFLLTDRRIAKEKIVGVIAHIPLFKEAAVTLAQTGKTGICHLIERLESDALDTFGFEDDFIREAVACGFRKALKQNPGIFAGLKDTEYVPPLVKTVEICSFLGIRPGRWDDTDPRRNLKLYKHFDNAGQREGLATYIEVLGLVGDERALPVLATWGNSVSPGKTDSVNRAVLVAVYRIKPFLISGMDDITKRILLSEFIAAADEKHVFMLLDGGISPDIRTLPGEPAVSLAFRKSEVLFEKLCESGADLNCRLPKYETMLIRAARKGDVGFADALLQKGASPDLENNAGEKAADVAFRQLMDVWNGRSINREAAPFFEILKMLKKSDSSGPDLKSLKRLSKKEMKKFSAETGYGAELL